MHQRRFLLGVMVCAGLVACGVTASRVIIFRLRQQQVDEDYAAILAGLRGSTSATSVEPTTPSEVGTLSPYEVDSEFEVVASMGQEHAVTSFVEDALALEVRIDMHTCRPRVMYNRSRSGEINLVDGSSVDQCTSGGLMSIVDRQRGETFDISFRLVGAPNGTLRWDAKELIRLRASGRSWRETLQELRDELPQSDQTPLPETVRNSSGILESRDDNSPHALLMSGDEVEMRKLIGFRTAFRELYDQPESPQAQRVARLLIDALLESETQQQLSAEWMKHLGEAG